MGGDEFMSYEDICNPEVMKKLMLMAREPEESWHRMAAWCFSHGLEPPECVVSDLHGVTGRK